MSDYFVIGFGLVAQLLFSARLIIQWIASERAHKVLSPVLFWQLSMIASLMLCLYGWMRSDFAIILGQFIAYYVYIWNLKAKGSWQKVPSVFRWIFQLIPVAGLAWCVGDWRDTVEKLFSSENIPFWLMVFGIIGQFTFTLRFIYQWWYSRRAGESLLPITFWLISLTGCTMIIVYAVLRRDPVLILGQGTGFIVYIRNIMIGLKETRKESLNT